MSTGMWTNITGYTLKPTGRSGEYLYLPDPVAPLTFTRPNGERLAVVEMFGTTDLGSVPRLFWWFPGFAPADLVPAALLHDALFLDHKTGLDRWGDASFQTANEVLYEGLVAAGYPAWKARLCRWGCNTFGKGIWNTPAPRGQNRMGRPWLPQKSLIGGPGSDGGLVRVERPAARPVFIPMGEAR